VAAGFSEVVVASPEYLSVQPNNGPSGIWVVVYGSGFSKSTSVTIYFDDKIVGTATTSDYGSFWVFIQIPEASVGVHTIVARDAKGLTASTTFTVTRPRITISPTSGPAGVEVAISGTGLGPFQVYTLKFDEMILETPLFTDRGGALELTIRVPKSAVVGKHNFTLVYIGFYFYWEISEIGIKYILYAPTTKIMTYATFEVISGAASSYDVSMLKTFLEELRGKLDVLNRSVVKITNDVNILKENVKTLAESIEKLNVKDQELLSRISILNQSLSGVIGELKGLEMQLSRVRGDLEKLASALSTVNTTLSRMLVKEVTRLNETLNMLEAKLRQAREDLEVLKGALNTNVKELNIKISLLNQSTVALNTTLRKMREDLESLIRELSSRVQEQSSKVEGVEGAHTTTRTITILATVIGLIAVILAIYAIMRAGVK
jgi:phage shock protein A